MITKKLTHQIITFLNQFFYYKNFVCSYTKHTDFICVSINEWSLTKDNMPDNCIKHNIKYIKNENDFNDYKKEIIKKYKNIIKNI